ncbi:transglycosylase SLT domain-containing protein [Saccharopolyspora sp. MS10]|uniref:transglycosylase SLT domain-containing protein n=1 Tax=Saccharopolyspora sp. MS10 TaxID=3385973 RepID=UPI0039A12E94
MGISGEIAGKPGGTALAEQVRRIEDADPEAIRDVARRWRESGGATEDANGRVRTSATAVDGAWHGASADAFAAHMTRVRGGFDAAARALEGSAAALDSAADAVRTGKDAVSAIGERALADARRAEDAFRRAERAHADDPVARELAARVRDDEITRAMEAHAREATDVVAEANRGLSAALDSLREARGGMADAFTRIPEAGSEGIAAPREQVREPARTEQAGTTGQPGQGPGQDAAGAGGTSGSGGSSGGGGSEGGASGSGGSAGSGGLGSSGGPPIGGPPPGDVARWIREAIRILQAHGIPVTEDDIDEIATIIQKESGGDPHAINDWDSNAAKGTPSKGLMQCIDPTFQAHKLPGHDDIYDPVDNIIAGVRYTFDRYGGFEGHPGLKSMAGGGGYQGY